MASSLLLTSLGHRSPRANAIRGVGHTARWVVLTLASCLLAACGEGGVAGERIVSGGGCPPGEHCSVAFRGLMFGGPGVVPGGIARTAVGGEQTLGMTAINFDGTRADLLPEFGASSSDVTHLDVVRHGTAGLTLRGVAPGDAQIRVTQTGTDLLLDRIVVGASEVAHVALNAHECTAAGFERTSAELPLVAAVACAAVWTEAHVEAAFYMTDASYRSVWDETLRVRGRPTGIPQGIMVNVSAPATGVFEYWLGGGSGTHVVSLPVVSDVLDFELTDKWDSPLVMRVGTRETHCAFGLHDDLDGRRGAILGAPAEFTSEGDGLLVEPPTPPFTGLPSTFAPWTPAACRDLTLTSDALQRLTVRMGSLWKTFEVRALPPPEP